jgi:RNA polymerase sigma factor (sigma-70 family)
MSSQPVGNKMSVSDEQFGIAMSTGDNVNIIRKVTSRYASAIHPDDLYTCGLNALWRTLQCHDPKYNQKFTTSLYRFVEWECQRELRKKRTKVLSMCVPLEQATSENISCETMPSSDHEFVQEVISTMDCDDQEIIRFCLLEGRSLREASARFGCSKQVARRRKNEAIKKFKERVQTHEG